MSKYSVQAMVDFALQPQKEQLREMDAEIRSLKEENERLANLLISSGWTREEVDQLIRDAEGSVDSERF